MLVRWWFEVALIVGVVTFARVAVLGLGADGALAALIALGVVGGGVVLLFEPARDAALALYQRCIVPHRVRTGLVQAGVASRDGRLPMIVWARCRRDQARLWLWLPAGVVPDDLEAARSVVATSCGCAEVVVVPDPRRQDRVLLVVARPRWGWPV